ncbi:MAG TPA: carboxypeptidase regulatory-like domain-containing protein [Bryobacteraceae bacterium]|nr:carboxypeptidase regulatory-like domain-containing protein [Bryobacteraceae bacterium]
MRLAQLRALGLLLVLAVVCAVSSFAQEFRGRIQGTITDTSQAAIVGATVTLLNVNTGVSTTRQSNETGHYIFDLVDPGTYTISVEFAGFSKFVQENVLMMQRGDMTVNATLKAGDVRETVTVAAEASTVQFNTAKLETTVDSHLTNNMPQIFRTPFFLAQLDPSVEKNDYASENMPYHSWGPNQQRVGGGQNYTNDLQVDGAPVGIGYKTSYVPSPDMVQEVNVQQNAIDAEYGHSSGSAISLTLKSGTNDWHGTAFYQGQYPWANALENRVIRSINLGRNHMYGGTVGHPILKNKLFNFVAYEGWNQTDPQSLIETLPTDLERQGNFSQSLNGSGGLRTIYDPWSTQTSADGKTINRTPFPGNIIPGSRIDPIASGYVGHLWKPNAPGDGPYHVNNYYAPLPIKFPYKNFSDRVDYQATDRLRASGRVSLFRTPITTSNPTGSDYFVSDRGSERDSTSITGDVTYTLSPRTVLNVRGDYHSFIDASAYASTFSAGWGSIWQNTNFYKAMFQDPSVPVLLPRMSISGTDGYTRNFNMGPGGGYWDQRPTADSVDVKLAQQRGPHYLKFGFETRGNRSPQGLILSNPGFGFDARPTSATYVNPNTLVSGDGFATFLIGAVVPTNGSPSDWDSSATSMPVINFLNASARFYAGYINDDWKVTRNLTINLGLRYEFEQAWREEQDRAVRPLDLTVPIPEFQGANAPQMPAQVKQFYSGPWTFNGAFQFAGGGNPRGQWNSGLGTLSPRIGAAYRLNDKTSIRAAYGRYVTPWIQGTTDFNNLTTPGFTNYTGAPPQVLGVPQMQVQNPFPSTYPVIPAYGKTLGAYTMLGDSPSYYQADRPRQTSDRFNFSVQRQLPQNVVLDVTYFLNLSNYVFDTTRNLNMVDPRIAYQNKDAVNQVVPNPFYNILTVDKFPGPLRYQQQVSISSLMKPYPQYGDINVTDGQPGGNMHYHSLQIKLTKSFSKGYSFLAGYNYHYEQDQRFYDDIALYTQNYSWINSPASRHRLTAAGTWELPFGKGRAYMSDAPRAVDAMLGGWNLTPTMYWRSGRYAVFGGMVVNGDPHTSNPGAYGWFNTGAFSPLPAYTPRTNPWLYSGITGPGQFNMDASLVKSFHVVERLRFELRMDVFNVLNNMTWEDPDTNIYSPNFGHSQGNNQLANTYGRRTQLGLRVEF